MTRRAGDLWPQIVAFDNLLQAAQRAARGKRDRPAVARYLLDCERETLALQREFEAGTYRPRPLVEFTLQDPKQRTIAVPAFRDRVLHHALVAVCEPVFERRMIHHSYASRTGKGQHAALRQAQRLLRRFDWSLVLDIEHCFESLEHEVVLETVRRSIKDRPVWALFESIVRAGGACGVGLPIGSLTSQWLANLVLDRLDHFLTEDVRVPAYLRYMDDICLFAPHKQTLRAALAAAGEFCRDSLRLRLKQHATRLAPAHCGMPFLGWQVYSRLLRPRRANLRRSYDRLRRATDREQVRSVLAHLRQGDTHGLRRSWFG